MKNIQWLLLLLMIVSCQKQPSITPVNNNIKEILSDPPPCSGNSWSTVSGWPFYVYPSNAEFDFVVFNCNNKIYAPSYSKQRMYIFDGIGWTFISSAIPWDHERKNFTSFTIGDKGYMFQDDSFPMFFEYNTTTNTWTQKAFFAGNVRFATSSFVIGNKAYVIGGHYYGGANYQDVWEYDPAIDTWTQKADLPPAYYYRSAGAGFSINGKGYIAGGYRYIYGYPTSTVSYNNDLIEYNPQADSWTSKASFPGNINTYGDYNSAASFVIGTAAYVGMNGSGFFKYTPSTNTWSSIATLVPQQPLNECTGVINSKGYVFNAGDPATGMFKYTPKTCSSGATQ